MCDLCDPRVLMHVCVCVCVCVGRPRSICECVSVCVLTREWRTKRVGSAGALYAVRALPPCTFGVSGAGMIQGEVRSRNTPAEM